MQDLTRKVYSIAQARESLPRILDDIADGEAVTITRRGNPVAVLLSIPAYRAMTGREEGFRDAYRTWRTSIRSADLELPRDYFRKLRDRSPGRKVSE